MSGSDDLRSTVGWLLLVLSVLWLLLTGGCAVFFLFVALGPLLTRPWLDQSLSMAVTALLMGAAAMAPGVLLFMAGRSLRKPSRRR